MSKQKIHYNPNTGKTETCGATKGNCPFGSENHFDNEKEAQAYADKMNEIKAKAEDLVKDHVTTHLLNDSKRNIKETRKVLRNKDASVYELANAHFNLDQDRYNVDDVEFYTHEIKSDDKEVEREAKAEINRQNEKNKKDIKSFYTYN